MNVDDNDYTTLKVFTNSNGSGPLGGLILNGRTLYSPNQASRHVQGVLLEAGPDLEDVLGVAVNHVQNGATYVRNVRSSHQSER
jgi:hypothetical protein